MIQVLGLREYYKAGRGGSDKKHVFFKKGMRHASIDEVFSAEARERELQKIPHEERVNVYFTPAECTEEGPRKFLRMNCVFFDVDGLDLPDDTTAARDAGEVARRVCGFLGVDFNETGVIFSGNGVQLFIKTTYYIDDEEYISRTRPAYLEVCRRLQAELNKANIKGKVDTSVWSASRLMRYPDTINEKPNRPRRMAIALTDTLVATDYDLVTASGIPPSEEAESIPNEVLKKFPPPDTAAVLEGCEFSKWAANNQADVDEPTWYAALSIWSRLKNGEELCHQFSDQHPGYSFEETQAKVEQALRNAGPRTCKDIDSRWGKCGECPHFGKVTSPILIRGKDYIASRDSGFRHIVLDKSNIPRPGKVAYEDVVRFFSGEQPYITLVGGRIYRFNGMFWSWYRDDFLNEWLTSHISPQPSKDEMAECRARIKAFNVRNPDLFVDQATGCMNFRNGVLNTHTGEFTKHSPHFGFTNALPFDYNPHATSPRWEQFLVDICDGDLEKVQCLKEFAGYAMSGDDYWYQKALLLVGEGSNGKSVFTSVIGSVVGPESHSNITHEYLNDPYYTAMLFGKLFNIAEETPKRSFYDSSTFKNLASGGIVVSREIYQSPIQFKNKAKLIFASNFLPDTDDTSHGFYRRLLIVEFTRRFSGDSADPFIQNKILEEAAGVVNSCIQAYKQAKTRKAFTEPRRSLELLEQVQYESNEVMAFANEKLAVIGGKRSLMDEVYQAYTQFAKDSGFKAKNRVHFWRAFWKTPMGKNSSLSSKQGSDGKRFVENLVILGGSF